MSIDVQRERPEETGIERYLITNEEGETIYAYWKVLYEEITEEFLYDSYVIKNVQLSDKGQLRKNSSDLNRSFGSDSQRLSEHAARPRKWSRNEADMSAENRPDRLQSNALQKKTMASFTPSTQGPALSQFVDQQIRSDKKERKYSRNGVCKDDMDTMGSVYNKATKKAQKKSFRKEREEGPKCKPLMKRSIYVPIGVCIETLNPSSEKAEQLLDSLIDLLLNDDGSYVSHTHNMIYSFAEFCSTVLSLTQITSPPPFAELQIPFSSSEVTYYEDLISNLPCEGDMSVAQLFSLIDPDDVLTLWTALLMERDVVIYTSNVNLYFFIAKPLMQLMFPLNWPFAKGIIPNLDLLSSPTPYCFGKEHGFMG